MESLARRAEYIRLKREILTRMDTKVWYNKSEILDLVHSKSNRAVSKILETLADEHVLLRRAGPKNNEKLFRAQDGFRFEKKTKTNWCMKFQGYYSVEYCEDCKLCTPYKSKYTTIGTRLKERYSKFEEE